MKIVSDKIFNNTLKQVKDYIQIRPNPPKYHKKILINLMPSFAFKQLIIFLRLGEYLKKNNCYVDYFICNGFFNHCDMVKMNDHIDRKLICERCLKVNDYLKLTNFCIRPYLNKIVKKIYKEKYFNDSIIRYCGREIKFLQYENETKDNLLRALNLKLNYDRYDYLIYLGHFQHYSIAPFIDNFKNSLSLDFSDNKIYIYGGSKKHTFAQHLDFNNNLLKKIEAFFKDRININKNLKLNTNKKIISFFPNLQEDSHEEYENGIFNSMLEWLIESVDKLKKEFFIIIKAHPSEIFWKSINSIIDYFEKDENIMLIQANSDINAYDIMNISDFIVTYNGTVFYEGLIMNKKVVLGGRIGDIYHKSKEEYFNQFYKYKPYNYKKAMEYGYKIIFTKAFKLDMVDLNLKYPHIKKENKEEISFKAIKDILFNSYSVQKYIDNFIPIYT